MKTYPKTSTAITANVTSRLILSGLFISHSSLNCEQFKRYILCTLYHKIKHYVNVFGSTPIHPVRLCESQRLPAGIQETIHVWFADMKNTKHGLLRFYSQRRVTSGGYPIIT